MSKAMQSIWKYAKKSLIKAQISQSNQANKYRKNVYYSIRDKMWLSKKNINTNQPFKKLNHKIIGLFEVIRKKEISLKLQLP